jgi:TP901 family phage tail tape measure protein
MATLALNVDPSGAVSGAKQAEQALDRVKRKAKGTEKANDQLSNSYTELRSRLNPAFRASVQFARGQDTLNQALKAGVITTKQAKIATRELELEYKRASTAAAGFGTRLKSIGAAGAVAGTILAGIAVKTVSSFRELDRALAETSTLIGGTAEETKFLDDSAKDLAARFGSSATQQVQAFYQAISAGVGDVVQANAFLETANKLAVGGVTEISTAVDLLSSVTNAYSASGLKAAEASDILFTGVRLGKTTVAELASSLGNVAPLASAAGVSLEEVVAAVAGLTSQGQSTSVAVTGIRQAIAALLKPTSEARKEAARLGISFDAAALESKHLAGVLADVERATGGSKESLAQLFGSVDALNAVLGLIGPSGDKFTDSLEAMGVATGATDVAFEKINKSLSQRLLVQLGILSNIALEVGEVLLNVIVPALEAATGHTNLFAVALLAGGTALAFFFPITGVVIALGAAITVAANNWTRFQAAGELALESVSRSSGIAASEFKKVWSGATGAVTDGFSVMGDVVKSTFNLLIGAVKASGTIALAVFTNVIDLVSGVVIGAVRAVVSGVEQILSPAITGINLLIDGVNDLAKIIPGFEGGIAKLGPIDLSGFKPEATNLGEEAGEALAAAFANASEQLIGDHIGNMIQQINTRIRLSDPRRGRGFNTDFSAVDGSAGDANDNGASSILNSGGLGFTTKVENGVSVTRPNKEIEDNQKTGNRLTDSVRRNTEDMVNGIADLPEGIARLTSASNDNLIGTLLNNQRSTDQRFEELRDTFLRSGSGGSGGSGGGESFFGGRSSFEVSSVGPGIFPQELRKIQEATELIQKLQSKILVAQNDLTILESQPRTTAGDAEIASLENVIASFEARIAQQNNVIIKNQQEIDFQLSRTVQRSSTVIGFAHGGGGRVPNIGGGADSVEAVVRLSPNEPFAFGDVARRGLDNERSGNRMGNVVSFGDTNININGDAGSLDTKAIVDAVDQRLSDFGQDILQRVADGTRGA